MEAISFWNILAIIISAAISAMGLGGGGVLILYLTLIQNTPQLLAQGVNLLFFIPCAITAIFIYQKRKLLKWKIILPMVLGGLIGVGAGSLLLLHMNTKYITILFAAFLIVTGLSSVFSRQKKK